MSRAPRGLTLAELLITLSIFGVILSLTLYFYGQSTRITQRHDQGSEVYRRASVAFADVERFLHSGILYYATKRYLVVSCFHRENFLLENRILRPQEHAQTLSTTSTGLVLHTGHERHEVFRKKEWEEIAFSPHQPDDKDPERRRDYVSVIFTSLSPSVTAGTRPYEFRRQVLLERY